MSTYYGGYGLWLSADACGIPGHPQGAHGGHPGCITHGPMHYSGGWWTCHGYDGEPCELLPHPVPDAFAKLGGHAET